VHDVPETHDDRTDEDGDARQEEDHAGGSRQ
jgi:hypothetical protein